MTPDCTQFYTQRDNRTSIYLSQPVEPVALILTITPKWAATLDGQLALYWLSSLVARMGQRYNHLRIYLPQDAANIPCRIPGVSAADISDALQSHLYAADPCGAYAVGGQPSQGALVVAVGDMPDNIPGLIVRPGGWSAGVAAPGDLPDTAPPMAKSNPVGAALAAAAGALEIYRYFNGGGLPDYGTQVPVWISAWRSAVSQSAAEAADWTDAPELTDTINIGRCMVVGAGALGGNALAILGAVPGLLGRVDIIDPDRIEISNLNRLVAALYSHERQLKVDVAADSLRATSVEVARHVDYYERPHSAGGARRLPIEEYDVVLTSVDQMATRAFVQSDWPRLLIDGGTRAYAWRVSTHPASSDGSCIGCLAGKSQRSYGDLQAPLGCVGGAPSQPAQVEVPMDSYSFVSFFGAAFLAARVLQQALGRIEEIGSGSISTQATALNLSDLQHQAEQASNDQCLCRCSHPAVRSYRAAKYSGGAK